jgi:hypothetical protein
MVLLWLKRLLTGRRWQLPYLGPTREQMLARVRVGAFSPAPGVRSRP